LALLKACDGHVMASTVRLTSDGMSGRQKYGSFDEWASWKPIHVSRSSCMKAASNSLPRA
jgi:hypothetical protein